VGKEEWSVDSYKVNEFVFDRVI